MIEVNINLEKNKEIKEGKNRGKAPLRFSFYYKGERYNVGAGERISTNAWDIGSQKVTRKNAQHGHFNKRLRQKIEILISVIEQLEKEEIEVTQRLISSKFRQKVKGETLTILAKENASYTKDRESKPKSFFEVVEHYRQKSGNTKETIRKWNQIGGHLKAFKPDFDFKDITEDFYNNYFLDHLFNIPICDNTIDKHIAEIKAMCTYAIKRFSHIKISPDYIAFKRLYKNPSRMSLTWDEVLKIQEFQPLTEEQQQAKDMFIISCYTGLRWQNVSDLKPHNFIEEGGQTYLNVITYKNGNPLRFPLPKTVKKIIEKYQREMPKSYNSDVNKEIQKVARACKLNDIVYVRRIYKRRPEETPFPKWKKVTMHVARHTFAVEFLRRNKGEGLTALKALSNLLNHSSTKVTEIYWNMISAEKDKMLLDTFD